MFVPNLKKAFC